MNITHKEVENLSLRESGASVNNAHIRQEITMCHATFLRVMTAVGTLAALAFTVAAVAVHSHRFAACAL